MDDVYKVLIELIQKTVPKASQVEKYGGILFTLHPEHKESQFCGVFQYASHAQLSFTRGAALEDTDKLLSGGGKTRRHINIISVDAIPRQALTKLIRQAAKG